MLFTDYFINLSIFSLLVSTPLIIRSFTSQRPLKHGRMLGGIYAGIVSVILMQFTLKYQGFAYDIRYVPVILSFVYLGPVPGLATGIIALLYRINLGGEMTPVILGWSMIMLAFLLLETFIRRQHPIKRAAIYFTAYSFVYLTLIPLILDVVQNNLLFHMEYLLFILAGLFIGVLLIESQRKLYSLNENLSEMYKVVATYQQELVHTLEQINGGIFKLKKVDDQFIFTFTEGHLFRQNYGFGIKIGMPINGCVPGALPYCQAAWNGAEVQFELDRPIESSMLLSLRPTVKDGKVVEIVGTCIDITEKKKMEKTLKESEFKYRLIAENTSDLIMVMDKSREFIYLSPSHEAVLGYYPLDLPCHPDEIHTWREIIDNMFLEKIPITLEYRWKHKNEGWIDMESRCIPVLGENHSVEHIVIVSRDISDRKQAEELLRRSEKLSVVGELAAGIAHEIRNPLTTLKGFVQLMKLDNPNVYYMDLLFGELQRIELITNELLSLAKPQAVKLKAVNIVQLVHNIIEILTPQAILNNIQIFMDCQDDPQYLLCEENQLKQAMINILKNAIEAMPHGGSIYVSLKENHDREVHISIRDEGCGIPEELLPRLGEPFYTLKEKGTGLGLMISQKMIKEHHGNLIIESKMGEGTTVHIHLPLRQEQS